MANEIITIDDSSLNETPVFDGLAFLSKIDQAETLAKKVKIFNLALRQEPIMPKNMKEEMKKKGLNAGAAQDYDYIPIGIIEEALRQIFFRQIDFIIKQSYRDLNSFIVVASLKYKCPISLENREVDGIGAKALQQDAGSKIFDFNNTMKANALELGVAIAYSRAVKNAAKKLGKMFGANLNRDDEMNNVIVFNSEVMNKVDDEHLKLAELFKLKQDFIPAEKFDSIKAVIDNKQVKQYYLTKTFLQKIEIPK